MVGDEIEVVLWRTFVSTLFVTLLSNHKNELQWYNRACRFIGKSAVKCRHQLLSKVTSINRKSLFDKLATATSSYYPIQKYVNKCGHSFWQKRPKVAVPAATFTLSMQSNWSWVCCNYFLKDVAIIYNGHMNIHEICCWILTHTFVLAFSGTPCMTVIQSSAKSLFKKIYISTQFLLFIYRLWWQSWSCCIISDISSM